MIVLSGNVAPKPYARTVFRVTLEQLSDGIRRAIERGTDRIAGAARRGAMIGAAFGAGLAVALVALGVLIGRAF